MTTRERRWQRRWEAERTRRKRAESSAREWQDRFRLFLDHAPMPPENDVLKAMRFQGSTYFTK